MKKRCAYSGCAKSFVRKNKAQRYCTTFCAQQQYASIPKLIPVISRAERIKLMYDVRYEDYVGIEGKMAV